MKALLAILTCCVFSAMAFAQTASAWLASIPQAKDYVQYVQKRASSYARSGDTADYRRIAPRAKRGGRPGSPGKQ